MTYWVQITDKALAEIDEALAWYAKRSVPAAVRWYLKLREAIRSLDSNPERHELAPECEWYPGELRQMLFGKKRGIYRVLYEIREETVIVLRVRHSAQDLLRPDSM
jgi:plasmid stabilization system protein ParE